MHDPSSAPRLIAFYMPSLEGGGAERVMIMLANGLAARGHAVDLVLASADGPYRSEVAEGVRIVDLGARRVIASLVPLVRYLRRARPQAMLAALNHSNVVALLARGLARVPMRLVVSEHNAPSFSLAGGGIIAVVRAFTARLYPRADAIVCVSDGICDEMEQLLGLPRAKLHRIYNPLDVDRIERLKTASIADRLPAGDGPLVLAAGRLTAQKDYPNLLSAFTQLVKTRPARLAILGQGEEEAALNALAASLGIADRVFFMGFQDNPFAWMRACDLYVLPSRWEGLPGTLLEALACDARIVSTDCRTGPREILEDGRWGRLVPVDDPAALAQAMLAALDDPQPPCGSQRAVAFRPERAVEHYAQALGL